jgi:acetylornithine deacetylase
LKNLVKIDSVNPSLIEGGAGEAEIAEYMASYLEDAGLETEVVKIEKDRFNVVGILKGMGGGSSLMLNGHMDTVGIKQMKIPPFEPRVEGNKMYGRGSADMKGGLAAMMSAAKAVSSSGVELKGDLIIAGVADEEYASIGTESLVANVMADAAIVCESTGLKVVTAHKGFVWIGVDVWGRAAHGSRPELGIDAIIMMGRVLREIEEFQKKHLKRWSHQLLGHPSVHASIIEGGRELSTYPDHCRLQLEMRTLPGQTVESVKGEIQKILDKLSKEDSRFKADLDIIFERGPLDISPRNEIVKVLRNSAQDIMGVEPEVSGMSCWLDSEIIWKAGIPVVIFGPGGEGIHAATECVYVDQVISLARILSQTTANFCS